MPPKRKSGQADGAAEDVQPRRSTRQRMSTTHAASEPATPKNAKKPATVKKAAPKATKQKGKQGKQDEDDTPRQPAPAPSGDGADSKTNGDKAGETPAEPVAAGTGPGEVKGSGRQYWLMKAEPESRIENGVDVRFSIDDLAAKSEPEPWDGMLLTHILMRVHVRTDKHLWHRYQKLCWYGLLCRI